MSDTHNPLPQGDPISGNMALCAFVEKSHLFKKVDASDLGLVYGAGRAHHVKAGQVIVQEGQVGDQLFLVLSGTVRVVAGSPRGPVELARLSRGAVFGEVGFLTGQPRTASVVALDSVEVISFARPDLDAVLKKYPKLRKVLQVMMSARAEKAIEMTTS